MGTAGEDNGTGGRQPMGLGDFFQDRGTGGYFIWVREVCADPLNGTGPGKFPAQGRQENYGEAAKFMRYWGIGVPTAGDINGGGRI